MASFPTKESYQDIQRGIDQRFDAFINEQSYAQHGMMPHYQEMTGPIKDLTHNFDALDQASRKAEQVYFPNRNRLDFQNMELKDYYQLAHQMSQIDLPMPGPVSSQLKLPVVENVDHLSFDDIYALEKLKYRLLREQKKQDASLAFVFDPHRKLNLGSAKVVPYDEMMQNLVADRASHGEVPRILPTPNKWVNQFSKTELLSYGVKENPQISFAFLNGIYTDQEGALSTGKFMSDLTGYKAYALYNATQLPQADIQETFLNKAGVITPPVAQCINFMTQHAEQFPNRKMFLACHSQGAAILKTALEHTPDYVRDLLVVRTYGGADYISKSLCKDSINYVSKRDWISKLASFKWARTIARKVGIKVRDENCDVQYLEPETTSAFKEHLIMNKTYQDQLKRNLKQQKNGATK